MRLSVAFLLSVALIPAAIAWPSDAESSGAGNSRLSSGIGPPPTSAPREFWDVWLRFHEAEFCLGLDALFIYHQKGLEVWCRIEDEKTFQKFSETLSPLRATYQIEVYPTRPPVDKKSSDDKYPPPSLWNNEELRTYLQDPFHSNRNQEDPVPRPPLDIRGPDYFFKQRMILFADQTLDWESKMNRYAGDLPALMDAATNSAVPEGIRTRAAAICIAHLQAVDRYADRLTANMSEALPKSTKKGASNPEPAKPSSTSSAPRDVARAVADSAQSVARRVYHFIHPVRFTVELPDLKEPSLLDSLRRLHKLVGDLQGTLKR